MLDGRQYIERHLCRISGKKLYTRHLEKTFKAAVKEGKTLRIQSKSLVSL
jgi:hypothetical protein